MCGQFEKTFVSNLKGKPLSAPSKAARELAEDVEKYFGLEDCTKPVRHMIAKRIDKFMAELLEKADKVLFLAHEHISPTLDKELRFELHKWKPGE